jgi:hypothetical protein
MRAMVSANAAVPRIEQRVGTSFPPKRPSSVQKAVNSGLRRRRLSGMIGSAVVTTVFGASLYFIVRYLL